VKLASEAEGGYAKISDANGKKGEGQVDTGGAKSLNGGINLGMMNRNVLCGGDKERKASDRQKDSRNITSEQGSRHSANNATSNENVRLPKCQKPVYIGRSKDDLWSRHSTSPLNPNPSIDLNGSCGTADSFQGPVCRSHLLRLLVWQQYLLD